MILVTGASGTLGKEIARQLARGDRKFKCLVRRTSRVDGLEALGVPLCLGDVTDLDSLTSAMDGVSAILSTHSLGIQKKGITYWDVDYRGNLELIQCLQRNRGGGKFVYISALGASLASPFQLYRVKQLVENALTVSGLNYTVFKPSGFFSDFTMSAEVVKKYHLYPAMGWGNRRIQGVDVGNVAYCAIDALTNDRAANAVFSMGGPEILTFRDIAALYSKFLGYRVGLLPIPTGLQKTIGWIVDSLTAYRYEIKGFVEAFSQDSTCDNTPLLDAFDVHLKPFETYLEEYLHCNTSA